MLKLEKAAEATGIHNPQVEKYYSILGQVPGALDANVRGGKGVNETVSMLTATMQYAAGSGRKFEDITKDLTAAFKSYNLTGEDALQFTAQIGELANKFGVPLSDMENSLIATADAFKMYGNEAKGAAAIMNQYLGALESTGLSGSAAVDVVNNMTAGIGKLSIAQKSFISSQTGGAGGLMGGFQIEKLMREGHMDQVMDKVKSTLTRQFGQIRTLQEASTNPQAAAQFEKQILMLRQGPLGTGEEDQTEEQSMSPEAWQATKAMRGGLTGSMEKSAWQSGEVTKNLREQMAAKQLHSQTGAFAVQAIHGGQDLMGNIGSTARAAFARGKSMFETENKAKDTEQAQQSAGAGLPEIPVKPNLLSGRIDPSRGGLFTPSQRVGAAAGASARTGSATTATGAPPNIPAHPNQTQSNTVSGEITVHVVVSDELGNKIQDHSQRLAGDGFTVPAAFQASGNQLPYNQVPSYKPGVLHRNIITWYVPQFGTVQMFVNPSAITYAHKKLINKDRTKGGYTLQYWGEELTTLNISGTTGSSGIEGINALYEVYRAEQYAFDSVGLAMSASNAASSLATNLVSGLGGALGTSINSLFGGTPNNPSAAAAGSGILGGQLADQINNQIGGNNTSTLAQLVNGQQTPYGSLGDYAQQIDQSAERRYVEEGFLRTDPYNTEAKLYEVLFQEPNATILVKKISVGAGTGVIEITNFSSFSTSVSVDSGKTPGTFNFSIQDPYQTMMVTDYDIERAIADATNAFYNSKVYQFGIQSGQQAINDAKTRLDQLRQARGASIINIMTNPNTLVNANQVVAIFSGTGNQIQFTYNPGILGLGNSVDVPASALEGSPQNGADGLSTSTNNSTAGIGPDSNITPLFPQTELAVFQQLISAMYNQLQLEASSQSNYFTNNQATNYVRRKLRFNFGGRPIIQPMDVVHMYVNSKSRYDNRLLDGLQSMFQGQGILQNLENSFFNLANQATALFNPSKNVQMQAEKAIYVGPSFPNFLWSNLRSQFVNENEGTHIFAGVVESAPFNWSDGRFTVNVSGKDNTVYFDMGKVNWKPGVDVFNGPIFDPLTPFKTNFDTISSNTKSQTPELLDENKYLLGTSKDTDSPLVKFKLGSNTGLPAREDNLLQDKGKNSVTLGASKIFYAPDGMVYKWKEGIGTLVQFGSSIDMNDPSLTGNPALTKEPFAGQDVMDVLSLLITGRPYNFANYWRTVANFDGFQQDPQSHQDAAYSYYSALQTDLQKTNITWGNFVPYKNLNMDEASFARAMQGQFRAVQQNQDLNSKLQQLAALSQQVNIFAAAQVLSTGTTNQALQFSQDKLKAENLKTTLATQIKALIAAQQTQDQSNSANSFGAAGDPSFDSNATSNGSNPGDSLSDPRLRQLYRRQLNFLTRRMSYNVRANEDKNLFIVDDYYDKDYDIIAYEEALADGVQLFNNEFNSVRDKIVSTADLLNLEVFADTQGHIRVRPPQYNRMPSSVFYRMLWLDKAYGIQVYPQFLKDLFQNQIQTLLTQLEVIENQIRLDCAVLGYNTDSACISFMQHYGTTSNTGGGSFTFISDESSFRITDMSSLISSANPDSGGQLATSIKNQANGQNVTFGNTSQYSAILDALSTTGLSQAGYGIQDVPSYATNTRIDSLIQAITTDTGQPIPRNYFLVTNNQVNNGVNIPAGQSIDVFKVVSDLSGKVTQRQQILKSAYGAIKNASEATSLGNDTTVSNSLSTPGIYGNQNVPEVFEHMIEDETYDDYGPGSGTRYIIKRAQVRNVSLAESPPDYTYVEVRGQLNPLVPNASLPGELNSFPQGGNGLVTAVAVDYDMWRKFGFRQAAPVNVPFLSDPNSQCAPYASMILSRARKNILRGTVTISGNEFMQPGEVIFLEDYQMLFYVTSVKHNFTYASGFTTTLDVSYGHSVGEYIPVTMDVIGKLLYNNRDLGNLTVQRQDTSTNDSNMGIVIFDPDHDTINTGNTTDSVGAYTETNTKTINNILYQSAYMVNANQSGNNNIQASVEIRIYYSGGNPPNTQLVGFANYIKGILTGQEGAPGPVQSFSSTSAATPNPTLPESAVSVVTVNLDDNTVFKSPSQKAIDMARNLISRNPVSGTAVVNPSPVPTVGATTNANSPRAALRTENLPSIPDLNLNELLIQANDITKLTMNAQSNDITLGSDADQLHINTSQHFISSNIDSEYNFTQATRRVNGPVKRDIAPNTVFSQNTKLENDDYEPYFYVIPMDPYTTPTSVVAGSNKNPPFVEQREMVYEFLYDSDVGSDLSELALYSKAGNGGQPPPILNRRTSRADTLSLTLASPNYLMEIVKGTVVDIFGNILDLNRTWIPVGTDQNTINPAVSTDLVKSFLAIKAMERRSVAYHFEINARKDLTGSNGQVVLPDINSNADHARNRSRFFFDIDKEGQFKLNVPASSETGNIGLLARYENFSTFTTNDNSNPNQLVTNVDNLDIYLDSFAEPVWTPTSSGFSIGTTAGSIGLNANGAPGGPIDRITQAHIKHGTAYHDILQTCYASQSNDFLQYQHNTSANPIKVDTTSIPPLANVVSPIINIAGSNANAGGRSGSLNFDGSLDINIGANTVDRQSVWLDTAGGIVGNIGRDGYGRSAMLGLNGDTYIQIGGFGVIGDARFANQMNGARGAVLDLRIFGSGGFCHFIRCDNNGITIMTPACAQEAEEQGMVKLASNIKEAIGTESVDVLEPYSYGDMENDVQRELWKAATHLIRYWNLKRVDAQKLDNSILLYAAELIDEVEHSLGVGPDAVSSLDPKVPGQQ
ncbi:unnamed protein product [Sphagnum balticum]